MKQFLRKSNLLASERVILSFFSKFSKYKICLLGLILYLFSNGLVAQKISSDYRPPQTADMPEWAKLMYQDSVNAFVLEQAYEDYYKTHRFEKSAYTLFYRRLLKENKHNINPDGSIGVEKTIPTEISNRERQIQTRSAGNWAAVGPLATYYLAAENPAQPLRPWQVNIYAFGIAPSNPSILYCGAETGGIYKTTNKGLSWFSVSDNYNLGTISAIVVHPTDPNIVYAATSNKIYKTTDGGVIWNTVLTLSNLNSTDMLIVPSTPTTIFHAGDSGLRKSTDSGATWSLVAGVNKTVYDIEINTANENLLYILHRNTSTSLTEFWRSTDGGNTFAASISGWTTGTGEAARMTVTPADANRIYVVILMNTPTAAPAIMRSSDGGSTWTKTCQSTTTGLTGGTASPLGMSNGQGYYDLDIMASTSNADEVIVGSTTAYKSTDGGVNFSIIGGYGGSFSIHPDIQRMLMVGGDAWISTDGGINLSTDFYSSTANYSARTVGLNGSNYWGFGQGWNEDILTGGRYHNGESVLYETYPAGSALHLGGGEAGTGYVMHGRDRRVAHSDNGAQIIPPTFNSTEISNFVFNKYPNEDGYGDNASEVEFFPNCYDNIYLGQGSTLWKTTDGGTVFNAVYTFNSPVRKFEICRSNPNTIYLATDLNLWKTTDGGVSWTALTLPSTSLINRLSITVSFTNPDELWIASPRASSNNRVFKSVNGGISWTNLTTATINTQGGYNIVHQAGTDGGVYIHIATAWDGTVFYRNNTMSDWVNYSANLPKGFGISFMKPFYKKGKLRATGNRGIWETDFYEPSAPLAQPTVDKQICNCPRDTIYFNDYSALKHDGATWSWSFSPTPQYVSATNVRNPKVVFGALGSYSATLTVTNAAGQSSTKTVSNIVTLTKSQCEPEPTAGMSLKLAADGDYFVRSNTNLKGVTHFTTTAWIKPNGAQNSFAGIVSNGEWCAHCGTNTNGLVTDYYGTKLWYRWAGTSANWGGNSGITLPLNQWSYVAMTVTPDSVVLFLNEQRYVSVVKLNPADLTNLYVGFGHYSHYFKGEIDEVTIWNRALSQNEIRELRHLTKENTIASDPNLIAYYQFNEKVNDLIMDKARSYHGGLGGGATLVTSSAPVGGGTSQRLTTNSGGVINFANTGASLDFSKCTLPLGEIVMTRINNAPYLPPNTNDNSGSYWILNYYNSGANSTFSYLDSVVLTANNTAFTSGLNAPNDAYLHVRSQNADDMSWASRSKGKNKVDNAIGFGNSNLITGATQLYVTNSGLPFTETDAIDYCKPDGVAGMALKTTVNNDYFVKTNANLKAVTRFTVTAWIKPSGAQDGFAAIVSNGEWCAHCGTNTNGLIIDYYGSKLWYRWAGISSNWAGNSGMTVPLDQWSYVAMVVTPDSVMLYLNEQKYTSIVSLSPADLNNLYIGYGHYSKTFRGEIDEVSIWNRSLSQTEIRQMRHLTKENSLNNDPNLIAYYQFNEVVNTASVMDKAGQLHGVLNNGATLVASTAPVGSGVSETLSLKTAGAYSATTAGVDMTLASGTYPNGDVVISRLNTVPNVLPTSQQSLSYYWIINNYGTNATFTPLSNISFKAYNESVTVSDPTKVRLFKRNSNEHLNNWEDKCSTAAIITGSNGSYTFNSGCNLNSFSQFQVGINTPIIPIELLSFSLKALEKQEVGLYWTTATELNSSHFEIEHSRNGIVFDKIGIVKASGNTAQTSNYTFTHTAPVQGYNYYRLKIYDTNGTFKYSRIDAIAFNNNPKSPLLVYPNPVAAAREINFALSEKQVGMIYIYNTEGQLMKKIALNGDLVKISVSDLAAGVYLYTVRTERTLYNGKIVIE